MPQPLGPFSCRKDSSPQLIHPTLITWEGLLSRIARERRTSCSRGNHCPVQSLLSTRGGLQCLTCLTLGNTVRSDMTCIGCIIGPRVSEYTQTSPSAIDYHIYPSGNKVIKAFMANDFIFYNKSGDLFILQNDKSADIAKKI